MSDTSEVPGAETLPDNFGGLPEERSALDRARFVVVPAPYDGTTTFLKGTSRGPRAVIGASKNMELYDEELGIETYRSAPIHTLAVPSYEGWPPEKVAEDLERCARAVVRDGRIPVTIGGEHSVSLGPIRACAAAFPRLSVLHVDAHTDLRDEYEGTRFGHGCVMRRVLEDPGIASLVQVGIRSLSAEEVRVVKDATRHGGRLATFFAHAVRGGAGLPSAYGEVHGRLTQDVYISVDVDAFDPALVPGTGTPEPGGLSWWEVTDLLRVVTAAKRIRGFDVVETLPLEGQAVSEFVAAKLIYRIMGYIARSEGA